MRILNLSCTISSTEREHKIYGAVHTPARNRLHEARVDRLVVGNHILRGKRCQQRPSLSNLDAFVNPEAKDVESLSKWYEDLRAAQNAFVSNKQ